MSTSTDTPEVGVGTIEVGRYGAMTLRASPTYDATPLTPADSGEWTLYRPVSPAYGPPEIADSPTSLPSPRSGDGDEEEVVVSVGAEEAGFRPITATRPKKKREDGEKKASVKTTKDKTRKKIVVRGPDNLVRYVAEVLGDGGFKVDIQSQPQRYTDDVLTALNLIGVCEWFNGRFPAHIAKNVHVYGTNRTVNEYTRFVLNTRWYLEVRSPSADEADVCLAPFGSMDDVPEQHYDKTTFIRVDGVSKLINGSGEIFGFGEVIGHHVVPDGYDEVNVRPAVLVPLGTEVARVAFVKLAKKYVPPKEELVLNFERMSVSGGIVIDKAIHNDDVHFRDDTGETAVISISDFQRISAAASLITAGAQRRTATVNRLLSEIVKSGRTAGSAALLSTAILGSLAQSVGKYANAAHTAARSIELHNAGIRGNLTLLQQLNVAEFSLDRINNWFAVIVLFTVFSYFFPSVPGVALVLALSSPLGLPNIMVATALYHLRGRPYSNRLNTAVAVLFLSATLADGSDPLGRFLSSIPPGTVLVAIALYYAYRTNRPVAAAAAVLAQSTQPAEALSPTVVDHSLATLTIAPYMLVTLVIILVVGATVGCVLGRLRGAVRSRFSVYGCVVIPLTLALFVTSAYHLAALMDSPRVMAHLIAATAHIGSTHFLALFGVRQVVAGYVGVDFVWRFISVSATFWSAIYGTAMVTVCFVIPLLYVWDAIVRCVAHVYHVVSLSWRNRKFAIAHPKVWIAVLLTLLIASKAAARTTSDVCCVDELDATLVKEGLELKINGQLTTPEQFILHVKSLPCKSDVGTTRVGFEVLGERTFCYRNCVHNKIYAALCRGFVVQKTPTDAAIEMVRAVAQECVAASPETAATTEDWHSENRPKGKLYKHIADLEHYWGRFWSIFVKDENNIMRTWWNGVSGWVDKLKPRMIAMMPDGFIGESYIPAYEVSTRVKEGLKNMVERGTHRIVSTLGMTSEQLGDAFVDALTCPLHTVFIAGDDGLVFLNFEGCPTRLYTTDLASFDGTVHGLLDREVLTATHDMWTAAGATAAVMDYLKEMTERTSIMVAEAGKATPGDVLTLVGDSFRRSGEWMTSTSNTLIHFAAWESALKGLSSIDTDGIADYFSQVFSDYGFNMEISECDPCAVEYNSGWFIDTPWADQPMLWANKTGRWLSTISWKVGNVRASDYWEQFKSKLNSLRASSPLDPIGQVIRRVYSEYGYEPRSHTHTVTMENAARADELSPRDARMVLTTYADIYGVSVEQLTDALLLTEAQLRACVPLSHPLIREMIARDRNTLGWTEHV